MSLRETTAPPLVSRSSPQGLRVATDPVLDRLVRATLGEDAGHYGVVVKELARGTGVAINADRVFYAASLFKLAVMYEAYRQHAAGQLSLATKLKVTEAAAAEDLGTMELLGVGVGDRLPVEELLDLMISASDNTASVLLRGALGRPSIDRATRALGLRATSVSSPDLPTAAADMAVLLEAIASGRAVSEAASREMVHLLLQHRVRDRIAAGLPDDAPVGNKTGNWSTATHDVAIVYAPAGTYVLAVLSDLPDDGGTIADLSRLVCMYYNGGAR